MPQSAIKKANKRGFRSSSSSSADHLPTPKKNKNGSITSHNSFEALAENCKNDDIAQSTPIHDTTPKSSQKKKHKKISISACSFLDQYPDYTHDEVREPRVSTVKQDTSDEKLTLILDYITNIQTQQDSIIASIMHLDDITHRMSSQLSNNTTSMAYQPEKSITMGPFPLIDPDNTTWAVDQVFTLSLGLKVKIVRTKFITSTNTGEDTEYIMIELNSINECADVLRRKHLLKHSEDKFIRNLYIYPITTHLDVKMSRMTHTIISAMPHVHNRAGPNQQPPYNHQPPVHNPKQHDMAQTKSHSNTQHNQKQSQNRPQLPIFNPHFHPNRYLLQDPRYNARKPQQRQRLDNTQRVTDQPEQQHIGQSRRQTTTPRKPVDETSNKPRLPQQRGSPQRKPPGVANSPSHEQQQAPLPQRHQHESRAHRQPNHQPPVTQSSTTEQTTGQPPHQTNQCSPENLPQNIQHVPQENFVLQQQLAACPPNVGTPPPALTQHPLSATPMLTDTVFRPNQHPTQTYPESTLQNTHVTPVHDTHQNIVSPNVIQPHPVVERPMNNTPTTNLVNHVTCEVPTQHVMSQQHAHPSPLPTMIPDQPQQQQCYPPSVHQGMLQIPHPPNTDVFPQQYTPAHTQSLNESAHMIRESANILHGGTPQYQMEYPPLPLNQQ